MKLLFDQNLSDRLVGSLSVAFPGAAHVKQFGLDTADDDSVWRFAAANGFTIVSKDSDFLPRALLHGPPSKLVFLRVGNCSTQRIALLLQLHDQTIKEFLADPRESLLVVQ